MQLWTVQLEWDTAIFGAMIAKGHSTFLGCKFPIVLKQRGHCRVDCVIEKRIEVNCFM